jgi:hypothetical protein
MPDHDSLFLPHPCRLASARVAPAADRRTKPRRDTISLNGPRRGNPGRLGRRRFEAMAVTG